MWKRKQLFLLFLEAYDYYSYQKNSGPKHREFYFIFAETTKTFTNTWKLPGFRQNHKTIS